VITGLDHIRVGVAHLEEAARAYEALLGFGPRRETSATGGSSVRFELSNTAMELHAGDVEGLSGLGFTVDDAEDAAQALGRRGLSSSLGVIDENLTGGVAMSLVEAPAPHRSVTADGAVEAVDHVVIHTRNPDRAVALYGARLGLDFRLDRTNPQWGSRLLFFRCGGAVLEISADLKAPVSDAPDRITGLAWRVRDPHAAQARVAAAGFDASELRDGRKPGTAVFTVRSGVVGAPALVIGPVGA